ncbi:peptidylprolyl isomerase [Neptunicella marina]|uniref:peptidylprolyl isomerase n=1 Tax=Neptunicella marina TaxID=2125989 RepID=A0A8J6M8L8_9ALTE|nr:peptidylprolyl isomerase [Neptunicella marina]MBC3767826.1 peptidylprolyl isomerase [Neptunicella marina]
MKLWIALIALFVTPVMAEQASDWRIPSQENLVYLQLDTGTVVIELAPFIAPNHVKQFKALVREGFYNGLDFYRVIDGFVAQGGDITEKKPSQHKAPLAAEFTRTLSTDGSFFKVQSPEFLADETGIMHGFAAGRDNKDKVEWLLHCYGVVAMARNNDINSGTTDFYINIGQAPRHLDRNMSVFGRVIYGMAAVQKLPRGEVKNGGVIDDVSQRGKILSASVGSDLAKDKQLTLRIQNEFGDLYNKKLAGSRTLKNEFFHYKGTGNIDVCYRNVTAELIPAE